MCMGYHGNVCYVASFNKRSAYNTCTEELGLKHWMEEPGQAVLCNSRLTEGRQRIVAGLASITVHDNTFRLLPFSTTAIITIRPAVVPAPRLIRAQCPVD